MRVINDTKPIKIWTDYLEDGAEKQARNLAKLPSVFKHIAIMPDSHEGYGMPIGGVLATEDIIIPNAVGVDIGCGMVAVKTNLTEINIETLRAIMKKIRDLIPMGFKHYKNKQICEVFDNVPNIDVIQRELDKARYQLGTLGGGNHFIEIQKGDDGHIWIMLHSGSRNFGLQIANEYHKRAVKLCEKYKSDIPHKDLSFLPIDSKDGGEYFSAMEYALEFAQWNRAMMLYKIKMIISGFFNIVKFEDEVNIHHNYAAIENHFGKNVIVHRKGATKATIDTIGIIPGSMGTNSYIVKGKGNPESFMSCSHGAGRKMSRKKAKETLSLETEHTKMKSILGKPRSVNELDEAPGAYKDIDEVMENQKDLVEILVTLKPLANIKG